MITLNTELNQVKLRELTSDDTMAIYNTAVGCQGYLATYMPWAKGQYTLKDAHSFVNAAISDTSSSQHFVIITNDTLVGLIDVGFNRVKDDGIMDIGYWVAQSASGKGIATAATKAVALWAQQYFELNVIFLHTDPDNSASKKVAKKAGFKKVGEVIHYDGRPLYRYSLDF